MRRYIPKFKITGARTYFLHNILHDWSDAQAQHILQSLLPALEPGYSKILINDWVVPDKGAPYPLTALDWELMTFLSAIERTEAHWRELIEAVHGEGLGGVKGTLKVTGIWHATQYDQSVIEVELA